MTVLDTVADRPINLLIVGAGGLGLWTLRVALCYLGSVPRVRLIVADASVRTCNFVTDLVGNCGITTSCVKNHDFVLKIAL